MLGSPNAPFAAGIPVKWTNGGFIKPGTPNSANPIPPQIVHHAALLGDLTDKATAAAARLLGEPGGLQMMRLRTRMNEVIVAPAADSTLVVMQKAHSAAMVPVITLADQAQAAAMAEEKKAAK